jgi:pSer/pThr/pTyr-binding forkhead associated (FHA) protein
MHQIKVFSSPDNPVVHDLSEDTVSVGRLADNHLQIEDESVSSRHAQLILSGETHLLKDLGSTNGTFVNGQKVTETLLAVGDQVRFGKIECIYGEPLGDSAGDQPLPENSGVHAEAGSSSVRPADFVNSSPFPKEFRKKDPLGLAAVLLAVLAFLAVATAVASTFSMVDTPVF